MRFRITHSNQEGIPLVNLHDEETGAIVSVAPGQGAMLHAFIVESEKGPVNIINNYQNIGDIAENLSLSYKSSKLSPFPCRIENGRYEWDGKQYEFANRFPDGSAIHGLLFNKHFAIKEQETTDYFAAILFEYDYKAQDPGYPFNYRCQIRYTLLHGNTLQVQTILQNQTEQAIPIADGWHPYFQLGDKVDDCTLLFPSKGMLEFSEKLIPTGKIIPYDHFNDEKVFGDTQLDNCFLVDPAADQPVCVLSNQALGLAIHFNTDEHYPYLQLYTPPDRKSIAIENLSSAPNCFNNKIGLLTLKPGETINLTLHYSVKTLN